ncbi:MAG TPA: amidophosphoribosyltransferase, partial [Candidatus Elarobacter sp.]|nr:amidophosphoribosyltransferase [Candidatus Elarobacter sp.]
ERGIDAVHPFPRQETHTCVFEYIYFARPDSRVFGRNVYEVRKALGRQLARESPVPADIVIAVPDSGVPAAIGYAEEAHLPYEMGLIRNHYVGRTFIEPSSSIRHFGVKVKLNALREVLTGKRVVVVDDSIVRGTTSRKLVAMIRQAGAREVHMRISSPPTTHPCFYGIDTPTREELIASSHSVAEIREYLGADSLAYLSVAGMYAFTAKRASFCDACFTGNYPIPPGEETPVRQLHLFEARER